MLIIIITNIKKYLSTNKLFLSYVVLSIISCTLLRAFTIGGTFSYKPFAVDLAVILVVGAFGYLIKPEKQFIYFLTSLILYTITNVCNAIYYTFYFSFATFGLLSSLGQAGEVTGSILQNLKLSHFIYLFIPILFIIINKKLKTKNYFILCFSCL